MASSTESPSTPLCILGAGPHGLALALHLHQAAPDIAERAIVLDPSGSWLTVWREQFERLGINVLRSPSVHHPSPDPGALFAFVQEHGLGRSGLTYDQPMSSAFMRFCTSIIDDAGLTDPIPERAMRIGSAGDHLRIETSGGSLLAERLVVASNPHRRQIPSWVVPLLGCAGPTINHAADIDLRSLSDLSGQRVVIVGGGLSAGHLAVGACARGAAVHLVARRPLMIRSFDTDPGWLGPKHLRAFDATESPTQRLAQASAARGGGTMPDWMVNRLHELAAEGRLCIRAGVPIATADTVNGHYELTLADNTTITGDLLWLATGTIPDLRSLRALSPVLPDIATVDGYPVPDRDLRIGRHPVHVMGRLATLELGPAAGNLWGARMAARRITRAVTGVDFEAVLAGPGSGRGRFSRR